MKNLFEIIQNSNDATLYTDSIDRMYSQTWQIIALFSGLIFVVLAATVFINTKYIEYSIKKVEDKMENAFLKNSNKIEILYNYYLLRSHLLKSEQLMISETMIHQNLSKTERASKIDGFFLVTQLDYLKKFGEGLEETVSKILLSDSITKAEFESVIILISDDIKMYYLIVHLLFTSISKESKNKKFNIWYVQILNDADTICAYLDVSITKARKIGIELEKMSINEINKAKESFILQFKNN